MKLYVYSLEDNTHVATITGRGNAACERAFLEYYNMNDYSSTYSPAFGTVDGLIKNPKAEVIEAD